MTHLYNKSDLVLIEKNIPDIVKKHKKLKFQNITVDIKEYERNERSYSLLIEKREISKKR